MTRDAVSLKRPEARAALCCPSCRGGLEDDPHAGTLSCSPCGRHYPVRAGVPLFLDPDAFDAEVRAFEQDPGTGILSKETQKKAGLRGWVMRNEWVLGPPIARDPGKAARLADLAAEHAAGGGLAVNVGSQGTRVWPEVLNLDTEPGETVDLLGDAHNLPLADASVRVAVSTSVFEHLREPQRAAAELFRILEPGGVLYLEVPWLYELHGCPMDFTRWTLPGLRQLLSAFELEADGPIGGPATVTARMLRGLAFSLTPGRYLRYAVRTLCTWGLFWMKYLDALVPLDARTIYAQGYWIRVRKPLAGA